MLDCILDWMVANTWIVLIAYYMSGLIGGCLLSLYSNKGTMQASDIIMSFVSGLIGPVTLFVFVTMYYSDHKDRQVVDLTNVKWFPKFWQR